MSDLREQAQHQLDAVRRDFEARLGGIVDEIVDAWNTARAASDEAAVLESLAQLVHRLAGNAGFFGLKEVSRTASDLESALERQIAAASRDGNDLREVGRLVRNLQTLSAGGCP